MSQRPNAETMRDEEEGIEKRISEAVDECLAECESEGDAATVLADELEEQARRVRRQELDYTRYQLGHHALTRAAGEFELTLRSYHRVYGEDPQEQTLSETLHRIEAIISEIERSEDDILPALETMEDTENDQDVEEGDE